ncbi:uncharacterized protein LOC132931745 [Rhopalosiphum padi]|uniref:uncharacterized protein LOC132931745 n=1 Tax=Rhopalosiphum padi TaxID=40932 RepID=UPI00298E2A1D|nr:uncharacterized protein LOC132931745 [Rhopalosiphum padi]
MYCSVTSFAYAAIALIAVSTVFNTHTVKAESEKNEIRCYVCNSHNDTACAQEKLPDHFKTECSKLNIGVPEDSRKNYTLCRKIIQTIEPEVNGLPSDKNRIIRTCGWDVSNYNNKCYHRSGFGGKQDVCTCLTDYCNSAQKTYIAFATVVAATFAILIL